MKQKYKILLAIAIVSLFGFYMFNPSKINIPDITHIEPTPLTKATPLKDIVQKNVTDPFGIVSPSIRQACARSSNGTLYTVYTVANGVYYSVSTDNGSNWEQHIIWDDNTYSQQSPTIAIDSNNTIYIFWEASTDYGSQLRYYIYNATSKAWSDLTTNNFSYVDYYEQTTPSIAIDSQNNVHIAYINYTTSDLEYVTFDYYGDGFSAIETFGLSNAFDPIMLINSTDGKYIIFGAQGVNNYYLQYTFYDDVTPAWIGPNDIMPDNDYYDVYCPDAIVDSNDNISVVFFNTTITDPGGNNWKGDASIQFISLDTGTNEWTNEINISDTFIDIQALMNTTGDFIGTSISIDDNNTIHAIWVYTDGATHQMMHNSTDGATWLSQPEILFDFSLELAGVQTNPNLVYALFPSSATPNIPTIGYAFVFNTFDSANVTTNVTFYSNCTWEETPPVVSNPNPSQGATGISTSLATVNVTINQTDGDLFDWTIEGGFLDSNDSTGDTTGVKEANVTAPLSAGTLYVWWVNTSDDDGYNNKTFYFTTIANQSVVLSYPNPSNGSYGNNLTLEWNITIQDPEGDEFNWSITVEDVGFNSSNYSTNGSYLVELSDLQGQTNYTVWINATDDNGSKISTNASYWFRTNCPLIFSYPTPANGSTGVFPASWNITIEDPEGGSFNWSIDVSEGVGGSYGYDNYNGSKSATLVGLASFTEYIIWVNATDNVSSGGSNLSTNETFNFTTGLNMDNIYVDDDADPSWYNATNVSSITEGIKNATNGTTKNVYVFPGTYTETPTLNKTLNLTAINGGINRPQLNGLLTISDAFQGPVGVFNLSINGMGGNEAIYIRRVNNVDIKDCNLTNSGSYIILVQGRYCNISYCRVIGSNFITIRMTTSSGWTTGNNVLWYNNISGSSLPVSSYCVELVSGVSNNIVVGNTFNDTSSLGSTALRVASNTNLIYHNNFINNTNHASDGGSGNIWNESYGTYPLGIIGGNYWEGHDQTDIMYGINQNIPGSDGISDSQYNVPAASIDYYPLTFPFYGGVSVLSFSNETPSNGTHGLSASLTNVSINITGTSTFSYNITGEYINETDNNDSGVTTGMFFANITGPLPPNTKIIWYVNCTDGLHTTNATYYFYTNLAPNVTNPIPGNGSTIYTVQPFCYIDANDSEGDLMDICWYQNTSGVYTFNQSNSSVTNGTYSWNYTLASLPDTMYYWMVTVNDSHTNVTYIFDFFTYPPRSWQNITWWNGTIINTNSTYFWRTISTWNGTINNQTQGGTYNITILYENETNGINFPVNLTQNNSGIHKFIIHFADETDYIWFNNNGVYPTHINTTVCDVSLNTSGRFSVTVQKHVKFFEFRWNDSDGREYYCTRLEIPTSFNVTMYIRTDLPIYGETSSLFNNSLVKYKLAFLDETGKYRYPNNPYVFIYKFNSSGERQVIHSEYFDPSGRVYPWLVYGDIYYLGVGCDVGSVDRISNFVASSDIDQTELRIPFDEDIWYSIYDLIRFETGFLPAYNGIYVHAFDTTNSTIWMEFTVYNFSNNTFIPASIQNISFHDNVNFTFTVAMGYNANESYKWQINISLSSLHDTAYEGIYTTGKVPSIARAHLSVSNVTVDAILQFIFGESFIYDSDNPLVFVPWTYIIIFIISLILLLSFGRLNSFIGGLAVGFWLILSGIIISGISVLYSNYTWWHGASLTVVGAFIIVLSVIGLAGGVER